MSCFPVPQISNKAVKTEASELNSGIQDRQCRFLTPSLVFGRKRAGGRYNSLIWRPRNPGSSLLRPSTGRLTEQMPWGNMDPTEAWSISPRPAFSYCHLSPFINNHLPQEWHISKAIPSSLALPSSTVLRSGGNSVINAEPQTVMSLPATVSFPSLIKEPLSGLPFHLPFLGLQSGDCCFPLHGVTGAREHRWQILKNTRNRYDFRTRLFFFLFH